MTPVSLLAHRGCPSRRSAIDRLKRGCNESTFRISLAPAPAEWRRSSKRLPPDLSPSITSPLQAQASRPRVPVSGTMELVADLCRSPREPCERRLRIRGRIESVVRFRCGASCDRARPRLGTHFVKMSGVSALCNSRSSFPTTSSNARARNCRCVDPSDSQL